MKKKKTSMVEYYLDNIVLNNVSGGTWDPPKPWNRIHGNGKSCSGGRFHIETMKDSAGRYLAKIVGTKDETVVVIDDGNSANGPSFAQVISVLKGKYC